MHHIVSDGWSMGVLVRELSALYDAYRSGDADPLPPLAIQYADYAAWQRRGSAGASCKSRARTGSARWRACAGAAGAADRSRASRAARSRRAAARWSSMRSSRAAQGAEPASRYDAVHDAAGARGPRCSSRLSGQADVVVGTPVANRTRAEVEELIGFFVNTLALRVDCRADPTVSELLGRVKRRRSRRKSTKTCRSSKSSRRSNPPRSLAHAPLFQIMFAWQNDEQASRPRCRGSRSSRCARRIRSRSST